MDPFQNYAQVGELKIKNKRCTLHYTWWYILFIVQRCSSRPNFAEPLRSALMQGGTWNSWNSPSQSSTVQPSTPVWLNKKKTGVRLSWKASEKGVAKSISTGSKHLKKNWKKKHGFKKISKLPTHVCFDLKIHVHALVLSLGKRNPRPEASMASTLVSTKIRSNKLGDDSPRIMQVKLPKSPNHRWCRNP